MTYEWLPLQEALKYEPEMIRLKVSEVARSPRGFLTQYKKSGAKLKVKYPLWAVRRGAFIARMLPQYKKNPTYRRWLALAAWAYRPDRRFG